MKKRTEAKISEISKSLSQGKKIKAYADAQKVIDTYNLATGRNAKVQYSSVSTSNPQKISNNGNFTTKVW